MAKGKKTGGRDWKPGERGGTGRKPMPPEVKASAKLTRTEVQAVMANYIHMDMETLQKKIKDKSLPMIDHMVMMICYKAWKDGCHQRLNFMFDRLIGKVKEVKEIQLAKPVIIERSDGKEIVLGSEKAQIEGEVLDA